MDNNFSCGYYYFVWMHRMSQVSLYLHVSILALASVYIFVSSPTCVFLGYLHGSDVSSLARKSSLAGLGRENSMSLVAETR